MSFDQLMSKNFAGENASAAPEQASEPVVPTPVTEPVKPTENEPAQPVTPVAEPVKTEESKFDTNKYLSEVSNGLFKSEDDFKSSLEKVSNYDKISQELSEYKTRIEKSIEPANDFIKSLNEAEKNGIDRNLFLKVNSVDIASLSEKEAIKLELQWKLGLTEEEAEFKVNRKYRLNEQLEADDPDFKESQIEQRIDAKAAKDFLDQYKVKATTPVSTEPKADVLKQWETSMTGIVNSFKGFNTTVEVKQGDNVMNVDFAYDVKDADRKELEALLPNAIRQNGWENNAEGQANANQFLNNVYFLKNRESIMQKMAQKISEEKDTYWEKRIHNPSVTSGDTSGGAAPIDAEQAIVNAFKRTTTY